MTAPQTVAVYRGKKRDEYETSQMDERIKYAYFTVTIPRERRSETKPCAHCGARLYLEGENEEPVVAGAADIPLGGSSNNDRETAEYKVLNFRPYDNIMVR